MCYKKVIRLLVLCSILLGTPIFIESKEIVQEGKFQLIIEPTKIINGTVITPRIILIDTEKGDVWELGKADVEGQKEVVFLKYPVEGISFFRK